MSAYDAGMLIALTRGAFGGALVVPVPRAAELIGVSRAQVYNLMAQGKLRWVKIGKLRRIEIAEIERFIAAHRVEG
jgi:excisionase family DNA binding protein